MALEDVARLTSDSLEVIGGDAQERAQKEAEAQKDGIQSVTMDGDKIKVTVSRDRGIDFWKNAMEAPILRAQLDQMAKAVQEQTARIDKQQQFMSSHPILSVLAQIGAQAAQDRRMPPITQAIGRVTESLYPTQEKLGAEKLGVLSEAIKSSQLEERMNVAAERAYMAQQGLELKGTIATQRAIIEEQNAQSRHLQAVTAVGRLRETEAKDKETAKYHDALIKYHNRMAGVAEKGVAVREAMAKSTTSHRNWIEHKGDVKMDIAIPRAFIKDYQDTQQKLNSRESELAKARAAMLTMDPAEKAAAREEIAQKQEEANQLRQNLKEQEADYQEARATLRRKASEPAPAHGTSGTAAPKEITVKRDANGNLVAQ